MPKEGSHYDLPIALAVMAAIGAIPARRARRLRGDRRTGARRDDQRRRRRAAGGDRRQRRRQGPDLPGALRPRGGLGVGRPRDSRAALADPARQPLQGLAGAVPPRAGAPIVGRAAAGPARHQGPGERQARARSRRGRRPQPPDERRARRGKVDARPAPAVDPAAAHAARTARSVDDPFGRRHPGRRRADRPAPVPQPPSFRLDAGAGRRRRACQARRDFARPQRRPVPRRTAGVPARRSSTACASRSRPAKWRSRAPTTASSIRRASS